MLPFCALICGTTCGTPPVLEASYYDCTAEEFREAGASRFILQACNSGFTDIKDATEWGSKATAGTLRISVPGVLTINPPEFTEVAITGCRDQRIFGMSYLVDFETYFMDSTLDDFLHFNTMFNRQKLYRMMFWDCAGYFWMENNWALASRGSAPVTIAGQTPGMRWEFSQPPHVVDGDGDQAKWVMQFRVRTGSRLMGQAVLPGVAAALGAV